MSDKWFDGLPWPGIGLTSTGGEKYWFDGPPLAVFNLDINWVGLFGEGYANVAEDSFSPQELLALVGDGIASAVADGGSLSVVGLIGDSSIKPLSDSYILRILKSLGDGSVKPLADGWGGVDYIIIGEGNAWAASDSRMFKSIDVEIIADPNLLVRFKPRIGAGGVLTYLVGEPDVATFWSIIGIDPDGWEEPAHGSLRWNYVKSDKAGLAVNIYVSPKIAAMVGHRDRIIVRKADA